MLVTSIFSFSHNVFKRPLIQGHLPFTTQSRHLTTLRKKPFENIVGEGENAGRVGDPTSNQLGLGGSKNIQFDKNFNQNTCDSAIV